MFSGKFYENIHKHSKKALELLDSNGLPAFFYVLRDGLTAEELQRLRVADENYLEYEGRHIFANFLPDDERPADVPAL